MPRTRKYIVEVPVIPGVSHERMIGYITEAVQSWCGQFAPAEAPPGWNPDGWEGDPLGPPCPLMHDNAVQVRKLRR